MWGLLVPLGAMSNLILMPGLVYTCIFVLRNLSRYELQQSNNHHQSGFNGGCFTTEWKMSQSTDTKILISRKEFGKGNQSVQVLININSDTANCRSNS